ncbi:dihydropteroate synthase [Pseudoxanthobacter sp.]|uniref:dihydropteroate synthase n=1 Tax=Pseudoxanthobacter sp. TaxID=1925742 RepID=UPI002FDFC881
MGIINATPDSFSDGGRHDSAEAAIAHGLRLVEEGADILDIGGESTRPGFTPVAPADEWARIGPVIGRLAGAVPVPLSVDTYKAETADRALRAGATIVNDIWGLQGDAAMAGVVARHGAALVAMHNRTAADPQVDILADIEAFFARTLEIAAQAGIGRDRIVLDPGIGFGKTQAQNVAVLAGLKAFRRFGLPLLVGASRKSMIGHLTGAPAGARLPGSIAAHVLAVAGGAEIVRVHDVAPHRQALAIADAAVRGSR